ncbi:phosphomannomutase [Erythrobacter fulvus]|nr:phosphomannomutase [Erythrobacter fulvus]
MRESGVAFGTSGARGLVRAMTDRVCYAYTTAFLAYLVGDGCLRPGERVALAGDLRPSTPRILTACSAAVRNFGCEPLFCGFVPTPTLAFYAMGEGIPAIMVTGSHIPDDRNGIKFYRAEGEILKDDEQGIIGQRVPEPELNASGALLDATPLPQPHDIVAPYLARYRDYFGVDALKGMRIGVYQHSAVGRDILADILVAAGAEIVMLGRSERFVPVDTEAVRPEDVVLAMQWVSEHGLDAIASTDGDSDRPLLADEHGTWLRGDVLAMLCAKALGMQTVITPISSNGVAERSGFFDRVERTRIGSPFVIRAMQDALAKGEPRVCGFEANGGFLLGSDVERGSTRLAALPTRDAVLPIMAVLANAQSGSVSALVAGLPKRFTHSDRLKNFAPDRRDRLMDWLLADPDRDARLDDVFSGIAEGALCEVDLTDGVRMIFDNDRVIHLRGSGNAPELRCYSEAETPDCAKGLGKNALAIVAKQF